MTLSRPVSVASWPVVGNVLGFTWSDCRYVMIGAPVSSFGMRAELTLWCAVTTAWNSVSAVGGSHVPAVCATAVHFPSLKYLLMTLSHPLADRVELLSVTAPCMTTTCGFLTCHAATQLTRPSPMTWPTFTLLKLT